jgi:hypothetical protein
MQSMIIGENVLSSPDAFRGVWEPCWRRPTGSRAPAAGLRRRMKGEGSIGSGEKQGPGGVANALARASLFVLRVGAGVGLWRIQFKLGVVGKTSFKLKSRGACAIGQRHGPRARTCNVGPVDIDALPLRRQAPAAALTPAGRDSRWCAGAPGAAQSYTRRRP